MRQCYQNNCGCKMKASKVDSYKIGMAYVPWQTFENLYNPCTALQEGTVFADLNQIFCGRRGVRVCNK